MTKAASDGHGQTGRQKVGFPIRFLEDGMKRVAPNAVFECDVYACLTSGP